MAAPKQSCRTTSIVSDLANSQRALLSGDDCATIEKQTKEKQYFYKIASCPIMRTRKLFKWRWNEQQQYISIWDNTRDIQALRFSYLCLKKSIHNKKPRLSHFFPHYLYSSLHFLKTSTPRLHGRCEYFSGNLSIPSGILPTRSASKTLDDPSWSEATKHF